MLSRNQKSAQTLSEKDVTPDQRRKQQFFLVLQNIYCRLAIIWLWFGYYQCLLSVFCIMSFDDCWHTSSTYQETSGKRGANFLILNQMIFTEYRLRYNTVYTKDAPFNISQGFLIIMDNIKNDVKWQKNTMHSFIHSFWSLHRWNCC